MFGKIAAAALAAIFMAGFVADSAEADHRKKHRRKQVVYYMGPDEVFIPRGLRFMLGDYGMTPDEYEAMYGPDEFDESYYDPSLDAPPRKAKAKAKPKKVVAKPVAKPVGKPAAKPATAKAGQREDTELTTASIAAPEAGAATAKAKPKAAPSSTTLSCDKAGQIITGYGFSSVKPETCTGKVYAFAAARDGKTFAIKLDSSNGELTEVKKLQ